MHFVVKRVSKAQYDSLFIIHHFFPRHSSLSVLHQTSIFLNYTCYWYRGNEQKKVDSFLIDVRLEDPF
jgi:hypothetical protein